MDAKLVSFTVRLQPEVKEAARAMSRAFWFTCNEPAGSRGGSGINDELQWLMDRGLRVAADELVAAVAEAEAGLALWQQIVRFLLDHPAAAGVLPENMAEGSAARAWLEEDRKDHIENPNVTAAYRGFPREEAMDEHASAQERLNRLTTALGAVQKAVR